MQRGPRPGPRVGLRRLPREADQRPGASRRRCAATCRAATTARAVTAMPGRRARRGDGSSSSTTSSRTVRLLRRRPRAPWLPRPFRGVGCGRLSRLAECDDRRRPARRRSCPAWTATRCARRIKDEPRTAMPPGRHGDGERGQRERLQRPRGRRRRLHHQAVRPGRAPRARAVAGRGSSGYHDTVGRADRRARAVERRAGVAGRRRRSPTSSAWAGCVASSPRRSPSLIVESGDESFLESHRARHRRRSSRPARLHRVRRDGGARGDRCGSSATTTRRSGELDLPPTRGRSSTSPATGSWSSSTTRCRATDAPVRAVRMALADA